MGGIIMKQFNLAEYLKNPSRKVVTRDNRNVRIICTDAKGNRPVIGLVDYKDYEGSYGYTKNGRIRDDDYDGNLDIFFAPEKHEGWINLYRGVLDVTYAGCVYTSEKEAKERIDDPQRYVTTVKIEWEE